MARDLTIGIICVLLLWGISACQEITQELPNPLPTTTTLKTAISCDALKNLIEQKRVQRYSIEESITVPATKSTFDSTASSYSKTNIQVQGVDEADIIKTDGKYIYAVAKGKLYVVEAYPVEYASIIAQLEINGFNPLELYVSGDQIVLIGFSSSNNPVREKPQQKMSIMPEYYPRNYGGTTVKIVDVSDKKNPKISRTIDFEGGYISSRFVDNHVYIITQYNGYDRIIPLYRENENDFNEVVSCSDVYVVPPVESMLTVAAIPVTGGDVNKVVIAASGATVYASMKNLYLAENNNEDETTIHRFSFEKGSINYVGSGKTPGRILNQFSLDEYEGKLRVATTKGNLWSGSSRNNLYVLDENMKIAGKLEDLAPGERIYSVRFMGKKAYVVTFKKVDPLFLIDFSDLNPKVLGKLKIPGYSDYLHPYDENHIIGIGKDAIDAEEGNFAWYQGLKMAMFDVSDVENPKEVDTVLLGARGSESPVLHNHKAFLFDKEKQLLVIPATLTEKKNNAKPNEYGDFVFQGALVFQVTPTGFKLRGNVTHIEDPQTYLKSGYYFESQSAIERSLYINDVLYTFSASRLQLNSLHDLQTLRKIDLNN